MPSLLMRRLSWPRIPATELDTTPPQVEVLETPMNLPAQAPLGRAAAQAIPPVQEWAAPEPAMGVARQALGQGSRVMARGQGRVPAAAQGREHSPASQFRVMKAAVMPATPD